MTRRRIVQAGVGIADREGLDAVSIRRIAAELGARPMSLYTYVASKDDLLRLMAEEIVAEVIVPDRLPSDWRRALQLIAGRSHQTFANHPWVLDISGRRPHLGRNAVRHAEQLLTAVTPLQLDSAAAWQVLFMINDYTLGHALRVAHAQGEPPNHYPSFDSASFPHLSAALNAPGLQRSKTTFDAGFETLLDGIEQRYGHRTHGETANPPEPRKPTTTRTSRTRPSTN